MLIEPKNYKNQKSMNPKISIATNLFDAKTRRSCLRLLIAIAILCWGSMARAQQSERWIGAATGTQTITITGSGTTPSGGTVTATVPLTVTIQ